MLRIFVLKNDHVEEVRLEDLPLVKALPLWIDAEKITQAEVNILQQEFNLHQLTVEDILKQQTRIKVEEFPDYLVCVFFSLKEGRKKQLLAVEYDFVLGKNVLISSHLLPSISCRYLQEHLEALQKLLKRGPDFVFHKLLDSEMGHLFTIVDRLDYDVEQLQEKATRRPSQALLRSILNLKKEITRIKRITLPQREKMSYLAKNDYPFISKKAVPYFRDVHDQAIRVSDLVDGYRESINNTFDLYMSSVSNSMNEVMKMLSIIATIALPLTVVSSIYGTNFGVLPGSGSKYGFWVMIGVMVIAVLLQVRYFKKRKWV